MSARAALFPALVAVASLLASACGLGHSDGGVGDGSSGGGSGGSGSGGSSCGGGGGSGCPSSVPTAGAACSIASTVTCEYGSDPDHACNTTVTCSSRQWSVRPPAQGGPGAPACPTPPASASSACPSSYAGVTVGSDCAAKGTYCAYPEGRCGCVVPTAGPPHVGGGAQWECDKPGLAGCPSPRPALGSPCTSAGLTCDYGACSLPDGITEACQGGSWTEEGSACPL